MTDSDTLKGLVEVNASLKRLVEAVQNKFLLPGPSRLDEKARTLQLSQFLVSDGRARVAALERIAGPQPEAPPADRQRPPPAKGHLRIREGPVAGRQHTEDRQGQATYGGSRSLEMHRHQTRHQYKKNS